MTLLFLDYPKLAVSLSVPERIADGFRDNFSHALVSQPPVVHHAYAAVPDGHGWLLVRDGELGRQYPTPADLMFALEEDLENALIARLDGWVGLHAGAVALGEQAIVTVGHSDTGKTSSTFQLIQLGLELVAEEVTPVDPATLRVHPFPQVLTLSRRYAEQSAASYPIAGGTLRYHDATMARFAPARVHARPVPIAAMLFPRFDPACAPRLEQVTPGEVLTETFRYCFPPQVAEEQLYDNVIRILERCHLWRVHTRDIASSRTLLADVIAALS